MALDLTAVVKAEMRIERLELPDNSELKFIKAKTSGNGYDVVHTFTQEDDWSIVGIENLYINVDFVRLSILDFTGFEDLYAQTEYAFFEGIKYKMERSHRPLGVTRVWTFKLEPIDDFPTTI
jgi:hypothetical protein